MDEKEKEKSETAKEEEKKADDASAEETGEETKEEDASKDSSKKEKEEDIDYDKELEEEQKRGKPDPAKAREAFQERKAKREDKDEDDAEGGDEDADKPLTRRDVQELEQRAYNRAQRDRAHEIAKGLAASDKEAELIFLKWTNRQFPENMPLAEQMEEAYVITHRKKFAGERTEALRALRTRDTATKTGASAHRDATQSGEPKISDADRSALKASGFVWDGAKRVYKKPLNGGRTFLYKDTKTGKQWRAA